MKLDSNYINNVFACKNEYSFNELALQAFNFQYTSNLVYRSFVDLLNVNPKNVVDYKDIPFLPIRFFKSHQILVGNDFQKTFKSSGTGNMSRSNHYVKELSVYEESFVHCFEQFFGETKDVTVLCLLPSYQEQGDSSLIYMTDKLIQLSNDTRSGYFLDNEEQLSSTINELESEGKSFVLFGVSYALLDYIENYKHKVSSGVIIETGGMKGRRKELTKEQLHARLKVGFGTDNISSEYGMTELLSQSYSLKNQQFSTPNWIKILIRDTSDPFHQLNSNQTGLINVIDLANIYSCCFIATDDVGRIENEGFKVLGRYDQSDIRGCNLLVQ